MKVCNTCKNSKEMSEFAKNKHNKDKLQYSCKECQNFKRRSLYKKRKWHFKKMHSAWHNKNKESVRIRRIRNRYNITKDVFLKLVGVQNNLCKICKLNEMGFNKRLSVDHCHKSGKLRGLLCHNCNTALGFFKDSIFNLQSAIEYLKETS